MAKRRTTGIRLIGELMQLRIDEHQPNTGDLSRQCRVSLDKGLQRKGDVGLEDGDSLSSGSVPAVRSSVLQNSVQEGGISLQKMCCSQLFLSELVYLDTSEELVSGGESQAGTSMYEREPLKFEVEQTLGCMGAIFSRLKRRLRARSLIGLPVEVGENKSCSFIKSTRTKADGMDKHDTSGAGLHVADKNVVGINNARRSRRHHRTASMRARCDMIESFWTEPSKTDRLEAIHHAVHRRCISWDDVVERVVYSPESSVGSPNKLNHEIPDSCLQDRSW